jgi:hypothetical protein
MSTMALMVFLLQMFYIKSGSIAYLVSAYSYQ